MLYDYTEYSKHYSAAEKKFLLDNYNRHVIVHEYIVIHILEFENGSCFLELFHDLLPHLTDRAAAANLEEAKMVAEQLAQIAKKVASDMDDMYLAIETDIDETACFEATKAFRAGDYRLKEPSALYPEPLPEEDARLLQKVLGRLPSRMEYETYAESYTVVMVKLINEKRRR